MSSPIFSAPAAPAASSSAPSSSADSSVDSVDSSVAAEEGAAESQEPASAEQQQQPSAQKAEAAPKQPAPEKKAPEAPEQKKPEAPKKYKIKVDGAEEELDEETLLKLAQMGRASNKRFQDAAQLRREAEELIALIKQDPRKVLQHPSIGLDPYKVAEDWLIEKLEQEKLSPEQQKIQEYEQKLKAYEEEKKAAAEAKDQENKQKLIAHYSQEYEREVQEALASSGLPRTAKTVRRMAEYMKAALDNGIELPAANVAKLVRQDYIRDISELFNQTDGDTLIQILGDEMANKIRKSDLQRLRAGQPQKQQPVIKADESADQQPRDPKTKRFMSVHEWREWQAKQR